MTDEEIYEVFTEKLDWNEFWEKYFLSDAGMWLHVHEDGSLSMLDGSTHYRDPEAAGVIFTTKTPGINNLDSTFFSEGFASRADESPWCYYDEEDCVWRHEDTGEEVDEDIYIEDDTGEVIGDLEALIRHTILYGDLSEYQQDIIEDALN